MFTIYRFIDVRASSSHSGHIQHSLLCQILPKSVSPRGVAVAPRCFPDDVPDLWPLVCHILQPPASEVCITVTRRSGLDPSRASYPHKIQAWMSTIAQHTNSFWWTNSFQLFPSCTSEICLFGMSREFTSWVLLSSLSNSSFWTPISVRPHVCSFVLQNDCITLCKILPFKYLQLQHNFRPSLTCNHVLGRTL